MEETVIISAARTPIGKLGGALSHFSAVDLGALAIKEVTKRADIKGEDVDLVIMGQVLQSGCGQIPSRQAAIKAGLPNEVPAESLNKVCASSFRAVTLGDQIIRCGDANIIIAGGMESMSNAPYASMDLRYGKRMFNSSMIDLMVHDGLWCAFYDRHMAVHGGEVAKEYDVTREEQDNWALRSQQLAYQAIREGKLKEEIIPIMMNRKNGESLLAVDESPRGDATLEGLAKLEGLFTKENTVTAGNAPGTNDAGAAIMLMSSSKAKKLGKKPLATIVAHTCVAEEAKYIASAPGNAINKLLQKVGMTIDEIDLLEVNEAFAAVALVSEKIVGWDRDKVNVNGGAIAYGHPIGASGARIIMTLIYEMHRRKAKYGIAAICSGAAQGDAILIRCDD